MSSASTSASSAGSRGGASTNVCVDDPDTGPAVESDPTGSHSSDLGRVVEVWLAGEWKELHPKEGSEILRRHAAGESRFTTVVLNERYEVDLDRMIRTSQYVKRTRVIRFSSSHGSAGGGFEEYRRAYHTCARKVAGAEGRTSSSLDDEALRCCWPTDVGDLEDLVAITAQSVAWAMQLRNRRFVDIVEWCHYWALEACSPSFREIEDINKKLRELLVRDAQLLSRLQMHFETALGESSSAGGGRRITDDALLRACRRIMHSAEEAVEKVAAAELLAQHHRCISDEEQFSVGFGTNGLLTYYDFLNLMLGRKQFKVSLWMYDISAGKVQDYPLAQKALLGKTVDAIWHTGVVVEWPEKQAEYWYGGGLFESRPGSTPFGQPVCKQHLGYTYKLREETWVHLSENLAARFKKENYDVFTHNCNHFSDEVVWYLLNQHIPDDVLKQPDLMMTTVSGRAARPLLNAWLGGFSGGAQPSPTGSVSEENSAGSRRNSVNGAAVQNELSSKTMWSHLRVGAIVQFCREEGGRPIVGQVRSATDDHCVVSHLDLWKGTSRTVRVPRRLLVKIVLSASSSRGSLTTKMI